MVSIVILAAHWLIIIGLTVRIVLQRLPVGISLAWLAVVLSVPFAGAFLYLLFGEKRLGRHRASVARTCMMQMHEWQSTLRQAKGPVPDDLTGSARQLAQHAAQIWGSPVIAGNQAELLADHNQVFGRLIDDIRQAEHSIDLQFYIWHEGGWVDEVLDALMAVAQRGVRCRVLADAVGSKQFLRGDAVGRLQAAGVSFVTVLPTGLLRTLVARADLRNHRKLAVIDGHTAYAGSQNLADPRYFKQDSGVGQWVDAMVRIHGPVVIALASVFEADWAIETDAGFTPPSIQAVGAKADGYRMQIMPSGPDSHQGGVYRLLLAAIYSAHRELILTTPYFVPDEAIMAALITAAHCGVEVTLVLPRRNDSVLVGFTSAAHYDELLAAGVKIVRFDGGLLHTKSLTIDGETSVFGSVNLDMRSLWLNFELSLLIYDAELTTSLRDLQQAYIAASEPLELVEWRQRPAWRRFVENGCRLASPLL